MPLAVVSTGFLLVFFAGSVNPVAVIMAKDVLDGGDLGYGLMNAAWAAGMLAASVGLLAAGARADARVMYLLSLILMAVGLGLTGAAPALAWAVAALAFGGLGNGLETVSINTLLQESVPNQLRARIFALLYTSMSLAQAAALPLGGGLAEWVSARLAYLVASGGLVATWAFAAAVLAGFQRQPVPETGSR